MRKKLLLMLFSLGLAAFSHAQEKELMLISPAGGISNTSGLSLEWSLGEFAVQSNHSIQGFYIEGFQQPIFLKDRLNEQEEISISVSPNPVKSILTVRTLQMLESDLRIDLTDLNGKTILSTRMSSSEISKQLDLSPLPATMYMLHLKSENGRTIKNLKIAKSLQ